MQTASGKQAEHTGEVQPLLPNDIDRDHTCTAGLDKGKNKKANVLGSSCPDLECVGYFYRPVMPNSLKAALEDLREETSQ